MKFLKQCRSGHPFKRSLPLSVAYRGCRSKSVPDSVAQEPKYQSSFLNKCTWYGKIISMTATIVMTFFFSRWTDVPFQNIYFLILIIYIVIHWLLIDLLWYCLRSSHCIFASIYSRLFTVDMNGNVRYMYLEYRLLWKKLVTNSSFCLHLQKLGNDTHYWK